MFDNYKVIKDQKDFDTAIESGKYGYLKFNPGHYFVKKTIDITNCVWHCSDGDLHFIYLDNSGYMFTSSFVCSIGGTNRKKIKYYDTFPSGLINTHVLTDVYFHTFYGLVPTKCLYGIANGLYHYKTLNRSPTLREKIAFSKL